MLLKICTFLPYHMPFIGFRQSAGLFVPKIPGPYLPSYIVISSYRLSFKTQKREESLILPFFAIPKSLRAGQRIYKPL